eukprot:jgi/Tetstr1/458034/TSEL_044542.t1
MSACLRVGRAGISEQRGSLVSRPTARGRSSAPSNGIPSVSCRSTSAPPVFGGASGNGFKHHRRAASESPRPCARPVSCSYGRPTASPSADRPKSSLHKHSQASPQGGTRLFHHAGSLTADGSQAQRSRSAQLAVNALLSPASVGSSQDLDASQQEAMGSQHAMRGGHRGEAVETVEPRSPQINPTHLRQESQTGTVRVRLTVNYPPSMEGMQLKAIGNRRALGSWSPAMAVDFEDRGDGSCSLDIVVPPGLLRYKLVMQAEDGSVLAEKGIRKVEVPSGRLAQSMPSCYFNISCTWGAPNDPVLQAARLPAEAHQRQIHSAEQQVARLRDRQAKLQARMTDLSMQIKTANSQITRIHEGVESVAAQEAAQRLGTPSTSAAQDGRRQGPPQDVDSLFDHPSWSGKPREASAAAASPATEDRPAAAATASAATIAVTKPAQADPVRSAPPAARPASPAKTSQGEVASPSKKPTEAAHPGAVPGLPLPASKSQRKDMFRSADCPAILLTGGAMLCAYAAGHVWRGVQAAIPADHRQAVTAVGAIAATIVIATCSV